MAGGTHANSRPGAVIEAKQIGRYRAMNRWMKRRIERSRERCEKAEKQNRPQIHTDERGSNQLAMDSRVRLLPLN